MRRIVSELKHGTAHAYQFYRCRCEMCTRAHAARLLASRQRRTARMIAGEVQVKHGVYNTYVNWGCRCDDCKAAARVARRGEVVGGDQTIHINA